jgi:mono/diheme cytochrome c family protein
LPNGPAGKAVDRSQILYPKRQVFERAQVTPAAGLLQCLRNPETAMRHSVAAQGAIAALFALACVPFAHAQGTTPAELLSAYTAKAGVPASPERGQALFNRKFGRDFDNCAACHGAVPTRPGKDLVTEKAIAPLAPAAQPGRLTDRSKVDFKFQVNCRDVIGRECTTGEKADIVAWLISLKP